MLLVAVFLSSAAAYTQTLPNPTRTAYKCEVQGKTHYSDQPCLGAKRLELEPTRGLSKSSGKEMVGKDVLHERSRESLAEAVRPLTGLDPKQFETETRRYKMTPEAKQECAVLDRSIPQYESLLKFDSQPALQRREETLFQLRSRYVKLRC